MIYYNLRWDILIQVTTYLTPLPIFEKKLLGTDSFSERINLAKKETYLGK